MTELFQAEPTWARNTTNGLQTARLDRLYINVPPAILSMYEITTSTVYSVSSNAHGSLSDHVPVVSRLTAKSSTSDAPPIADWICRDKSFAPMVEQAFSETHFPRNAFDALLTTKRIFHSVARKIRKRDRNPNCTDIEKSIFWAMMFVRGHTFGWLNLVLKSVHALPKITRFMHIEPNSTTGYLISDEAGLHAWIAELQLERLESRSAEAAAVVADSRSSIGAVDAAKRSLANLHRQSQRWSPFGKKTPLRGIRGKDGNIILDPEIGFQRLADYWKHKFAKTRISKPLARAFVSDTITPFPADVRWRIPRESFDRIVDRAPASACGPDGISALVWRLAPPTARHQLWKAYEALFGDELPGSSFNESYLQLLAKGDQDDDHLIMARQEEDTRPLSLSNNDAKNLASACNAPLAELLPRWAHDPQRGLIRGRQLLDNVVLMDAYARLLSMMGFSGSALLFTDFAAAFPSVAWSYIFIVLEVCRAPPFFITALRKFYRDLRHTLRYAGISRHALFILTGVRQGCPMSGSIFAIVIEPLLRLLSRNLLSTSLCCAFADDIGIAITDFDLEAPRLRAAFLLIGKAANLWLKQRKCIIVPLELSNDGFRTTHLALIPEWSEFDIQRTAKYLGIFLGHDAAAKNWTAPFNKYHSRVLLVKSNHTNLLYSIVHHNIHASSVLSFAAQLFDLPRHLVHKSANLLQFFTGAPRHAIPSSMLQHFREYGFPVQIVHVPVLCEAALLRTACKTITVLQRCADALHDFFADNQAILARFVAHPNGAGCLGGEAIWYHLLLARQRVLQTPSLAAHVPGLSGLAACRSPALQKGFYQALLPHAHHEPPLEFLPRRLLLWLPKVHPELRMLSPPVLADAMAILRDMPPCVIAAVLKTWCNGWVSLRRFGAACACPVRCGAHDDRLRHLLACPLFLRAWSHLSSFSPARRLTSSLTSSFVILGLGPLTYGQRARCFVSLYGLHIATAKRHLGALSGDLAIGASTAIKNILPSSATLLRNSRRTINLPAHATSVPADFDWFPDVSPGSRGAASGAYPTHSGCDSIGICHD